MTYRISEVAAASPEMSDQEFAALVNDIHEHGQLVPIWKSGDEIIDGRKRLRACEALGIAPKFVDVSASQDAEALSYSMNIVRTHYTVSQRAMFASRRATMTRADAGRRRHDSSKSKFGLAATTVQAAAAAAAVSRSMVMAAKEIRRNGTPEVVAAVEAGRITIHSAQQILKVPKSEHVGAIEKVVQASRGKIRNTPGRALGAAPMRQYKAKPANEQRERAIGVIEQTAYVLDDLAEIPIPASRVPEWLAVFEPALHTLRKFHRQLKEAQ